ncbi:hypothetical protein SAMN06296952_1204 [Oscillospiraceae bacterium]|nr:hypothetical protein SAMN06296952_1204 [Oscillospiraceae bacterium]
MKRKEVCLSIIITTALLFSAGCNKKIERIEKEDIQDAVEELLGEGAYDESDSHKVVIHLSDDRRDAAEAELDYALIVTEEDFNLIYYLFEDPDEAEIFYSEYEDGALSREEDLLAHSHIDGESGYFITHADVIDMYAYYSDDMVMVVFTRTGDVSMVEDYIQSLGLPIK